jgi:hypothetical protein
LWNTQISTETENVCRTSLPIPSSSLLWSLYDFTLLCAALLFSFREGITHLHSLLYISHTTPPHGPSPYITRFFCGSHPNKIGHCLRGDELSRHMICFQYTSAQLIAVENDERKLIDVRQIQESFSYFKKNTRTNLIDQWKFKNLRMYILNFITWQCKKSKSIIIPSLLTKIT